MSPKQVVSAPQKARLFFDRKVRKEGGTRALSMGKIIPKGWLYVRLFPHAQTETQITVIIVKLLGEENHAQTQATDTQHK